MIHTFSANPSLLSGKPALTSFRKFSVQLPIGWLGAVTPRRSLPTRPDREGSSSSTRRTYTSPEAAPGASLRLIACLVLDTAVLLIYQRLISFSTETS